MITWLQETVGSTGSEWDSLLVRVLAAHYWWKSGRRPLAALRAADLMRLRSRLLRCGAQPTALAFLEDAIQADVIITEAVGAGRTLIEADEHPLGATVHQRKLTNLITWPFTGMVPAPLREIATARSRRGPAPDHPTLTEDERTRFFDHLLVTADANLQHELPRRQAIYLLGFDARASTADWLHTEQLRALRDARSTDHPRSWSGVRLLSHLLERLHPSSGHAELNLHTMWALLLVHPSLLAEHSALRSATASKIDYLAEDPDLSAQARRELSGIAYGIRLARR